MIGVWCGDALHRIKVFKQFNIKVTFRSLKDFNEGSPMVNKGVSSMGNKVVFIFNEINMNT